jgi:C-terminal processing protease CtpA/Prc
VDVSLVRDDNRVAAVKGERPLWATAWLLRITQFSEPAVADFAQALVSLEKDRIHFA